MKKAPFLALALTVSAGLFAATDTKPIEDTFQHYWSAYAKKDLAKAAAEVLPSDLEAMKNAVLPVFVEAQGSKDREVQEILGAFFGRTVGKSRETMTPVDVFVGLNRLVMAGDPQMFDQLKDAAVSIIFVRTPGVEEAEVHFQVTVRGASDTDSESLVKKNGRWWVRLKDDPNETAAHFKTVFTGK